MGLKWDPTQLAKDLAAGFQFNTMFSGEELAAALTVLDDGGGVPFTLGFTPEEHAVFERFAAQVEQQYAAHPQGDNLKDAISPARLAAWVADHLAMLAEEGLGPVQAVESKDGAA
jgi:hypothetical protein